VVVVVTVVVDSSSPKEGTSLFFLSSSTGDGCTVNYMVLHIHFNKEAMHNAICLNGYKAPAKRYFIGIKLNLSKHCPSSINSTFC
jgi:hypothetical protein